MIGELVGELFEGVKEAGAEIGAELGRLGTQGQMELANALFNGNAFVPYGPGQYTPDRDQAVEPPAQEMAMEQPEMTQEMGRSM
ncbi:MAG TPA: hypothetical protein VFE62_19960 [Gemmataceae bacterium]|nr:hypothetical protein [Gemmataceae bacterium]